MRSRRRERGFRGRRGVSLALAVMLALFSVAVHRAQAATTVSVPINPGWNLIDVPLANTGITTLGGLVGNLNAEAGPISAAAIYSHGAFRLYVSGYSADVALLPSSGIFVLSGASSSQSWSVSGDTYSAGQPVQLTPGWNLVAAPYPSAGLSTSTIASEIGAGVVQEIATYAGSSGYSTWRSGGSDFTVQPTQGMWIESAATRDWRPGLVLQQISSDPFTDSPGIHATEVEPDTLSYGSTVVSAFQVGRIADGGSSAPGWATYRNGAWSHGILPGTTLDANPQGSYGRASDLTVAYDPKAGVWLVAMLLFNSEGQVNVAVSRSKDSTGTTWNNAVVLVQTANTFYDKEWIVCDTTGASAYYGNCYVEFDNASVNDEELMITSTDGGVNWSAPVAPSGAPSGLGGQPLVRPDGTVIVPYSEDESGIGAFSSVDGGATWDNAVTISSGNTHSEADNLRTPPLPSAEIDGSGKVYVVWQDCRFEASCDANDIVMSTLTSVSSTGGMAWSDIARIPIDPVGSGIDHFTPGLAVNRATSGSTAQLALTYYYFEPSPSGGPCTSSCNLDVGFVSSTNGGATWSSPTPLAGPMLATWLPDTTEGSMFGDYISTSFDGSTAIPVFPVAQAPMATSGGTTYNVAMYAVSAAVQGGGAKVTATSPRTGLNAPVPSSGHRAPTPPPPAL